MHAITVSHLKKSYQVAQKAPGFGGTLKSFIAREHRSVRAVDDISFTIEPGELVGFIGPNGAGKTTTLKCLSGLLLPSAGDVSVLSHTPFDKRPQFLRQIALVMGQKNQLWWDLPPTETFLLNKEIYGISDHAYRTTLDELVGLLDIAEILHTPVRKLSLGQRMKCELVAALLHQPKILFLDEPTIGLDVVMQKAMREFIASYNKQFNATILLTSHYMDDVKHLCKRVIIIDHGKIIYDGQLAQLVARYAEHKTIVLTLEAEVPQKTIAAIVPVTEYRYPRVHLRVARTRTKRVASQLLSELPVADIEITELEIEDIIRNVFAEKQSL